jgi:membrane protease YdiL (CAAX protease family)
MSPPLQGSSAGERVLVLLEVSLVALLVAVTRMGFKYFAPAGTLSSVIRQTGAGVIIVGPMLCLWLWWRGKDFKAYGITLHDWREGLKIGVVLSLLLAGYVCASLPILRHAGVDHFTGFEPRAHLIVLLLALPGLALFVWILRFSASITKRTPTVLAGIALVALWQMPLALVRYFDQSLSPAVITSIGSVVVAGLGEELIFRGYIQSRLNEVLGRPFRLGGTQFGWGLFIASFLFGLVHIFNGVDFTGPRHLQWTWGLSAFLHGTLVFGYLREKTGSILSGAILHGNNDAWALIVANLR